MDGPMKLLILILGLSLGARAEAANVRVGSKAFTEGYTLGELVAERLGDEPGTTVERRFGMGATGILYAALKAGEIDLYPEYTGTIAEAILKRPELKEPAAIAEALAPLGLTISPSLGFENNYALAVPEAYAKKHNLRTISDLKNVAAEVRSGFSHEFMSREDGYRPLVVKYGLKLSFINAMDHALSYRGVASGAVDLLDVYSTDAKIKTLNLRVLEDDKNFFTRYEAVVLARLKFTEENPGLWHAIQSLKDSVSAPAMIALNEA
ncbi:MAG: ABC transporter permease, partial [Proteobacteria bacterium]